MADEYGYKCEYAKSGRAGCKGCKGNIGQDSLRMAVMVQSPFFDGKQPNWFHFACFWKRGRPTATDEIGGYDDIRWDDQQKIKKKIAESGVGAADTGGTGPYKDFKTEYAKSGQSKCRSCEDAIPKGSLRISRKDYESQRAKMYGPQDLWYHVDCFVKDREDLEFSTDHNPDRITGFKSLGADEQKELVDKLGAGSKKRKGDANGEAAPAKKKKSESVKESKEDKALKDQSQLLWKLKDKLKNEVSKPAMQLLLEYNAQDVPSGEANLIDRISDNMAFGVPLPCKECKGQIVYSTKGFYRCTGDATEWTKCQVTTMKPDRKAMKIPKEFHDVEFLKKYKYVKRDRVFPAGACLPTGGAVSSGGDVSSTGPLAGCRLVLGPGTRAESAELDRQVRALGGQVTDAVDGKVLVVVRDRKSVV